MTRWVDQPSWADATARTVLASVANEITHEADQRQIWEQAQLEAGDFPYEHTSRACWRAMLRDAHDQGKLARLLEEAQTLRPALVALIAPAFAEVSALKWYTCTDRFTPRMLGPGARQAMINRSRLSDILRDVVNDDFPVCNITGKSGAGKSHSRHLIRYLAEHPEIRAEQIRIDIANEWRDGVDAPRFARGLAQRLGMSPTFDLDADTHAISIADDLARTILGRFAGLPPRRRWIFIDGLDRPGVTRDVHVLVGHLALAVASGDLRDTRLFITGHPGDFHSDVLDVLCDEQIAPIDRAHLQAFFNDVAGHVGSPLNPGEAEELADKVLQRSPLNDLKRLGQAASAVAIERFKAT